MTPLQLACGNFRGKELVLKQVWLKYCKTRKKLVVIVWDSNPWLECLTGWRHTCSETLVLRSWPHIFCPSQVWRDCAFDRWNFGCSICFLLWAIRRVMSLLICNQGMAVWGLSTGLMQHKRLSVNPPRKENKMFAWSELQFISLNVSVCQLHEG